MRNFLAKGALERLTRRFAETLPGRVARVAADVEAALATSWDPDRCSMAQRSVHGLVCSSGIYGFLTISQVARGAEKILAESLRSDSALPPEKQMQLRHLLGRMGVLAAAAAAGTATTAE